MSESFSDHLVGVPAPQAAARRRLSPRWRLILLAPIAYLPISGLSVHLVH
jgi:hypothetical protein